MNDDEAGNSISSKRQQKTDVDVNLNDKAIRLLCFSLYTFTAPLNIGAKENLHFNGHYGCKKNKKPTPLTTHTHTHTHIQPEKLVYTQVKNQTCENV